MLRSRILSDIDMPRLSNAVSRPGIDPRVWVSYAVLTDEPKLIASDNQQDIMVDIQLLPTGEDETARVGAIYAGNGFGLYAPLHTGDEVLVCAPSGDPDAGLVIVQRLWSPADPPSPLAYSYPQDMTLVVEKDRSFRLKVQGAGDLVLEAEEGKVKLGSDSATRGVARLDDTTNNGTFKLSAVTIPPVPPAPPAVAINLEWYAPGNTTPVPNAVSTVTLAVATLVSALGSISATGTIDSASEKVVTS